MIPGAAKGDNTAYFIILQSCSIALRIHLTGSIILFIGNAMGWQLNGCKHIKYHVNNMKEGYL
jgi:hypothetical protein